MLNAFLKATVFESNRQQTIVKRPMKSSSLEQTKFTVCAPYTQHSLFVSNQTLCQVHGTVAAQCTTQRREHFHSTTL